MRLHELYVDGFGHFHHKTIGPMQGSVTVLYGPNEAGKSTLLAFIRAILFGFPTRFNSHFPPLTGGRHGGRITLSDDVNGSYVVERYSGARGGLQVTAPTGPTANAETQLRQLVGPATPEFFKTVFTFSLDELNEAAALQGSSIYSAGQGVPGMARLEKSLLERKGSIYKRRGSLQALPKLLNALRDVDRQLKAVEGNADRFGQLNVRRLEIGKELESAKDRLLRLDSRRSEIDKLLDGWESWVALTNCESRLSGMPRFEHFPENAATRLESFEDQARQARKDLEEGRSQLQQTKESASVAIHDEALLDDAGIVEGIRRARSSFDSSVRDLPERKSELRRLEADLSEGLAEVGHGWDEGDVVALDTSIVVRSQADRLKQQIAERRERFQQARVVFDQERRVLQSHQAEVQQAREDMPLEPPPLDSATLTERSNALRAARGQLDEYERERQNHENLLRQLNTLASSRELAAQTAKSPNSLLLVLLGLVGAALIVVAVLLGEGALPLGIASGLALLTTVAILYLSARASPIAIPAPMTTELERQTSDAEAAAEKRLQSLMQLTAALGHTDQPNTAALELLEADLESARTALNTWTGVRARVEETSRREKSQELLVEAATKEYEAAKVSAREAKREWQQWLRERDLDESLTADTMTSFLARIDATRVSLNEARRMRERVAAIERDIAEFRNQVESLAMTHNLQLNPDDQRQLAAVADELIQRLDDALEMRFRREQAKESAEDYRRQVERQEQRLQAVEQELSTLLVSGGTVDPEEFRRRARQHLERVQLERQRDEHLRSLERLCGPFERLAAFRKSLEGSDPSQLSGESVRLSEQRAEIDDRCNALREERGGIDNALMQLTDEEESSALRIRRSILLEQLREYAREWSQLTIAETLLERTRQKFEQERQPSVIRHAQEFFSSVTGQRYRRLFAPIGEQTIVVTDSRGGNKHPQQLSRGTREQLYLALRFGLIREFGEHAQGLPVVVDEALVNFDPGRSRMTVQAFAELSRTNQILVFTCQPSTADMFRDLARAQVVCISQKTA